jgi:hypothetical protein
MKRKSRILAIAIPLMVILLGTVIYQYGYLKVQSDLTAMEDTESVKLRTLEKYINLIADKPRIEEKLAAMRETRKAESTKMIEGQTPSVAAATLQNSVKGMITARGGSISSDRVEKPEDAGKFKMITVTVDAVLPDTRALGDTLYAIETQTPYLVVRELDTRIRNFKEPRDLMVKLKVSGLTGGK